MVLCTMKHGTLIHKWHVSKTFARITCCEGRKNCCPEIITNFARGVESLNLLGFNIPRKLEESPHFLKLKTFIDVEWFPFSNHELKNANVFWVYSTVQPWLSEHSLIWTGFLDTCQKIGPKHAVKALQERRAAQVDMIYIYNSIPSEHPTFAGLPKTVG